MKIALDAMGGDFAPELVVAGGVQAHRELGVEVVFVGPRTQVDAAVTTAGGGKWAVIEDAPEVIAMDEHPAQAVRKKRASSIVRGVQLVAAGKADAFVSAGNSGAIMAGALLGLRRLAGIERPALITAFPTGAQPCYLLDVGANVDATPEQLRQWAVMGSVYVEKVVGRPTPRVALLSIGEEPEKGNQLVRDAEPLLRSVPAINFVGNVEGKDIFQGKADVVVADAFSGNVLIKTAEGTADFLFRSLRDAVRGRPLAMMGGALIRSRVQAMRRRYDWREFGGALLLGVTGVVVIAHGRSDARAIRNAIRVGRDAAQAGVVTTITAALGQTAVPAERTGAPQPESTSSAGPQ